MNGDGELWLMIVDSEVHLVAHDKQWHMQTGRYSHVSNSVDGDVFTSEAKTIDDQTLLVTNLSHSFVSSFVGGYTLS
jgi:hypothetical protein